MSDRPVPRAPDPAAAGPAADHAADTAALQAKFAWFAVHESPDDPLYVAICNLVAGEPAWAGLLTAAPVPQQLPVLWLASVHDRVLERVEQGDRPPLADYYASATGGPARAPNAELARHLGDFLAQEDGPLRARIATRATQTNEINRGAVFSPILHALAARGLDRIALLDVGTSAGLAMGVDRWRYEWRDDLTGAPLPGPDDLATDPNAPLLRARVLAGSDRPFDGAAAHARPVLVTREGIDLAPIDVHDDVAVRWLRACLWPHDTARRERLDAAVAIARAARWPVRRVEDTTTEVERWIAAVPADRVPLVLNSWVLQYFEKSAREAHVRRLLAALRVRGGVWVSAEHVTRAQRWWPDLPAPRPLPQGSSVGAEELANATAWTVVTAEPGGEPQWWLAARSHAHGRWMQWTS